MSNQCHSSQLGYQESVLKTFPGTGHLCSHDMVADCDIFLVNLYVWLTFSSCYGCIPLVLGLIGSEGCLSTPCHS